MRKFESARYSSAGAAAGWIGIAALFAAMLVVSTHPAFGSAQDAAKAGAQVFESQGCAGCHFTDSRETKIGPGLKGLFKSEKLPASGRPATEENVRAQLISPYKSMPSYKDRLTQQQTDELIAYLKTL